MHWLKVTWAHRTNLAQDLLSTAVDLHMLQTSRLCLSLADNVGISTGVNRFVLAGLPPVAVSHTSSVSPRHSTSTEAGRGTTPRRRRPKQPQPTLVIMPDGQSLCFAVRLPESTSPQPQTAAVKQDGIEQISYQSQDGDVQQTVAPPVAATLDSAHELAVRDANVPRQVERRSMQS